MMRIIEGSDFNLAEVALLTAKRLAACWTFSRASWLWLRGCGQAEPEPEQAPRAEGLRQALDRELADLRARGLGDMVAQGAEPGDLPEGQRWQGWNIVMDQAVQANRPN
jgi:hypothetical protein